MKDSDNILRNEEKENQFLQNLFYFGKFLPRLQDGDSLRIQAKDTN